VTSLAQIFVFLVAAVVAVPVARRLGLGAVLGYLIAGIVVGPFLLDLVGDREQLAHIAEFGVVMMLFLIGLELEPERLWRMRVAIFGLGTAQVAGTAAVVAAGGIALGLAWQPALAIGLIFAMSSTAIVLQVLAERGWNTTRGGQASFAVLLFQDISVIPILAVLPLLATQAAVGGAEAPHGVAALPAWEQAIAVLGAVAVIVIGGRYVVRPLFRIIARTEVRELFTAAALLLVVGVALLMEAVGLSAALGAFLGGVVLANSEYRHELEGDIEPFKGLLLGLFFITVGAGIDFAYIAGDALRVVAITLGLMAAKLGLLFVLGRAFRLERSQALLLAFSLAQGGEFAFVLLGLAQAQGTLATNLVQACVAAVALSMLVTPPLLALFDRLVLPRFQPAAPPPRESDVRDEGAAVLIAGFGRVGSIVGRVLKASGVPNTVLDLDPGQIEALRKVNLTAYYGDASRIDLLHAAGAARAKVIVVAVDDQAKTRQILEAVKMHFPHLRVIVRVRGRFDAYELYREGYDEVHRETFGTALDMSESALRALGFRAYQARRAVLRFRHFDEATARELATHARDDERYLATARARIADAEKLLSGGGLDVRHADHGFDNAPLRAAAATEPAPSPTFESYNADEDGVPGSTIGR
jgi:monovalent cation:proton antiporter-2 (CPA2) family protein